MNFEDAIRILNAGGGLPQLAEAIGTVIHRAHSDASTIPLLLKGLRYRGFVAEQAALALHHFLELPIPADRSQLEYDPFVWKDRVSLWMSKGGAPVKGVV